MSSWIEVQANRESLQDALNRKLNWTPPLAVDGDLGPLSMRALRAAYAKYGVPDSIHFDSRILPYLFEAKDPSMPDFNLSGIGATAADYFLNFISSKINWAAALLVGLVVGWINSRFGFNVPADVQNWVTGLLVTGGGAIIMILRTFFNSPKVMTGGTVVNKQ